MHVAGMQLIGMSRFVWDSSAESVLHKTWVQQRIYFRSISFCSVEFLTRLRAQAERLQLKRKGMKRCMSTPA